MFRVRYAVLAILLITVLGAMPVTARPPSGQSVISTVSLPYGVGNNGTINAKFVATPNGDGMWAVKVTFKPQGVSLVWNFMGHFHMTLRGTATAQATATPGSPVIVAAAGCYWSFSGGNQMPALITCTFTIGANGVVSVSSISVSP